MLKGLRRFRSELRVKRGAKYLDRVSPGWHKRINLSKLEMRDDEFCIVGQLKGDFGKMHHLGIHTRNDAFRMGLYTSGTYKYIEYTFLNAGWRKEIQKRLALSA